MTSARGSRKRAAGRKPKPRSLSTSEARANLADVLETAHAEDAVIGFDRYGRTVAALVPVEAIYMLAGLGRLVPRATRKRIEEGAALFARTAPHGSVGGRPAKAKPAKAAAKKPASGRRRSGR
jgi:hypothetical protein